MEGEKRGGGELSKERVKPIARDQFSLVGIDVEAPFRKENAGAAQRRTSKSGRGRYGLVVWQPVLPRV